MRAAEHPLYRDDAQIGRATMEHLAAGRTIFQMFQFGCTEFQHARRMLDIANPPHDARVLSLGCGVGGMERLWQLARPDLTFELVNISAAQLDLCACEGERVLADAQGYVSPRAPFDLVVLACMLGHVDATLTMRSAWANVRPGGRLLVADCFDSTPEFDACMFYSSPRRLDVSTDVDALWVDTYRSGLRPTNFIAETLPHVDQMTKPAVLLLEKRFA